jgi:serine O-acetyltransferase
MFEDLRADAARYAKVGGRWYSEAGFWVGAHYRFGRWAAKKAPSPLRTPLVLAHKLVSLPIRYGMAVHLSRHADIGPGLLLSHPHSIMVPSGAKVGKDCAIYHEVTLGMAGNDGRVPELEDGVVVFAGSRILGGVKIGAHAEIGANCVVMRDIPPGAAFSVAPARVVPSTMLGALRTPSSSNGKEL